MRAFVEVRVTPREKGDDGFFTNRSVCVQVVPDGVSKLDSLNRRVAESRGIEIHPFGKTHARDYWDRREDIAKAQEFSDCINAECRFTLFGQSGPFGFRSGHRELVKEVISFIDLTKIRDPEDSEALRIIEEGHPMTTKQLRRFKNLVELSLLQYSEIIENLSAHILVAEGDGTYSPRIMLDMRKAVLKASENVQPIVVRPARTSYV